MSHATHLPRPSALTAPRAMATSTPAYQAFATLYAWYVALPIVAGLDKFTHYLVNWDQYLAPIVTQVTSIPAHTFMLGAGVIEIIAGVLVAVWPRVGACVVAAWLCGIVVNLFMIPGFFDVAVRDFGLALGALALALLS